MSPRMVTCDIPPAEGKKKKCVDTVPCPSQSAAEIRHQQDWIWTRNVVTLGWSLQLFVNTTNKTVIPFSQHTSTLKSPPPQNDLLSRVYFDTEQIKMSNQYPWFV